MSGSLTHGRFGKVFIDMSAAGTMALGTTAAGTSVLNEIRGRSEWSLDLSPEFVDVTCMSDSVQTKVAGLAAASGDINGFWDFAGSGTLVKNILPMNQTAERSLMIFPDATNYGTVFWSGKVFFGAKTGAGVTAAVQNDLHFEAGPTGLNLYP